MSKRPIIAKLGGTTAIYCDHALLFFFTVIDVKVMSGAAIPIVLCLEAHCLVGTITASGQRVLEILNDPGSQYLKMSEAALQPHAENADPIHLREATIPKARIAVCILTMQTHETPDRRMYSVVEKHKRKGFALVQGYEVQGVLSLKGIPDAVAALGREFGEFFPISDATVRHAASNRSFPTKVAIVNKSLVSALDIGEAI